MIQLSMHQGSIHACIGTHSAYLISAFNLPIMEKIKQINQKLSYFVSLRRFSYFLYKIRDINMLSRDKDEHKIRNCYTKFNLI